MKTTNDKIRLTSMTCYRNMIETKILTSNTSAIKSAIKALMLNALERNTIIRKFKDNNTASDLERKLTAVTDKKDRYGSSRQFLGAWGNSDVVCGLVTSQTAFKNRNNHLEYLRAKLTSNNGLTKWRRVNDDPLTHSFPGATYEEND